VTGAIVGAGGTLATFALVTVEASALPSSAVADTATSALSVLVESTNLVGHVHPGKLEGAHALGAIARVVGHTHAPVIVAFADIVGHASAVAGTRIVAHGSSGNHKGKG